MNAYVINLKGDLNAIQMDLVVDVFPKEDEQI